MIKYLTRPWLRVPAMWQCAIAAALVAWAAFVTVGA